MFSPSQQAAFLASLPGFIVSLRRPHSRETFARALPPAREVDGDEDDTVTVQVIDPDTSARLERVHVATEGGLVVRSAPCQTGFAAELVAAVERGLLSPLDALVKAAEASWSPIFGWPLPALPAGEDVFASEIF